MTQRRFPPPWTVEQNPWRLGSVITPPRPLPKVLPRRHRIGPEARCLPGFLFWEHGHWTPHS